MSEAQPEGSEGRIRCVKLYLMNNKFRNIFMAFGIIAIIIMLCTMDMDYTDILALSEAGGHLFPADSRFVARDLLGEHRFLVAHHQRRG